MDVEHIGAQPHTLHALAGSLTGRAAIVAGNGESRLGIDLDARPKGTLLFGCNALYRDVAPDYLGAVDVLMTEEIVRASATEACTFIAPAGRVGQWLEAGRHPHTAIETSAHHDWTTGPIMVEAAAVLGCDPIYLVGFDLDWTPTPGRVNSVYKGTPLYVGPDAPPCGHVRSWPHHLGEILTAFPGRRFMQIGPATLPVPSVRWEDVR